MSNSTVTGLHLVSFLLCDVSITDIAKEKVCLALKTSLGRKSVQACVQPPSIGLATFLCIVSSFPCSDIIHYSDYTITLLQDLVYPPLEDMLKYMGTKVRQRKLFNCCQNTAMVTIVHLIQVLWVETNLQLAVNPPYGGQWWNLVTLGIHLLNDSMLHHSV